MSTRHKKNTKQREKLQLTENAIKVLEARYLKKDEKGDVCETPEKLFKRVAQTAAEPERKYKNFSEEKFESLKSEFYNLMARGRFLPNSPTLMNAGREMGLLSACFVLPVEDSIDGIFSAIKHTALIQKAGGGTGFSFSRLRPRGDIVKSSGGTTSGPLSFLNVFSQATEAIQQGAFRRGANMGIMLITHPDIVEFIKVKEDLSKLTNFNLSVSIPNEFMEKVQSDPQQVHFVTNPRNGESQPLQKKGQKDKYWTVGELFNLIVDRAWQTGEPGVVFIDRINENNPTPRVGEIEATNPCGEQPLLPYEACNLGSINLGSFVEDNNGKAVYNFKELKKTVRICTRYLDNIVDANKYPLPEIEQICQANRKIGLGIMGFADALFKLKIPYNSDEALKWGERFMKVVNDEAHNESEQLAEQRGEFPNWKDSHWDYKFQRRMRNACVTTVAPTGTISILANCSGGVEPMFSLAFYRNVLDGQKLVEVNETFKRVAEARGFYSQKLIEQVAREGTLKNIDGIPQEVKRIFVTARDIAPEWHVRMQASFQKHCDSSISKTINFPAQATRDDIEIIYRMAYDLGCKGVTVYRDGCRKNQPMALENEKEREDKYRPQTKAQKSIAKKPITLPEIMSCLRIRQKTPFGNMHVKISVEPRSGIEREVFAQLGKGGDLANSDLEAICRILSLFLRSNGSIKEAASQLDGIGSSLSIPSKDGRVMSLADGLGKAIKKYLQAKKNFGLEALLLGNTAFEDIKEKQEMALITGTARGNSNDHMNTIFKIKCPECANELCFSEGCMKCIACGFSQC